MVAGVSVPYFLYVLLSWEGPISFNPASSLSCMDITTWVGVIHSLKSLFNGFATCVEFEFIFRLCCQLLVICLTCAVHVVLCMLRMLHDYSSVKTANSLLAGTCSVNAYFHDG
jgi:hypothetical protein